jgi:uncharacterized protein
MRDREVTGKRLSGARLARGGALGCAAAMLLGLASVAVAAPAPPADLPSDIPANFERRVAAMDFEKRDVMIPMRDGVALHTVIVIPRGAHGAPMLLTRTPYGASSYTTVNNSTHLKSILSIGNDTVVDAGYIRIIQDVRGKYGSKGSYVMNRPLRGPLNPSRTDHSTDTYDTIEWLVRHVPEGNGRVGMIGTSYDGFLVLMGVIGPHPALKVAVAIAPMVDPWMGDDWFHNGAFRQIYAADYAVEQSGSTASEFTLWRDRLDDYDFFLGHGSAADLARATGTDQLPFWRRLAEHPAYDAYWREQAVDRLLAARPLLVPTMYVHGLWDQEDIYGAPAAYAATEPKDATNDRNFLVIGPWSHGGSNRDGSGLGVLRFNGDTARWFRREVLQPFLDEHLKDGAPRAGTPPVLAYETGTDRWRRYDRWPVSCASGCAEGARPLYLSAGGGLTFAATAVSAGRDEYVSDPAKPVPYRSRPMLPVYGRDSTWGQWLVDDQRNLSARTDVLVYTSDVLTEPVRVAGAPSVHLYASTSGTDADWVVKLIDVYPDEYPEQRALGGYELMVSADVMRGRYRESLEKPAPLAPGAVLEYGFALPLVHHVFAPGHRIRVTVQSSWFPLYDRNPQTFVPNIFNARPGDYQKATQAVHSGGSTASRIDLPVAADGG